MKGEEIYVHPEGCFEFHFKHFPGSPGHFSRNSYQESYAPEEERIELIDIRHCDLSTHHPSVKASLEEIGYDEEGVYERAFEKIRSGQLEVAV